MVCVCVCACVYVLPKLSVELQFILNNITLLTSAPLPCMRQIEPSDSSWQPSWTSGLVAAVVVIAVIISALLFFALLLFHVQKDLLGMMTVCVSNVWQHGGYPSSSLSLSLPVSFSLSMLASC